jgi:hypothetical protein
MKTDKGAIMAGKMTIGGKITLGFGGALFNLFVGVVLVTLVAGDVSKTSEQAKAEGQQSFELAMVAQQMRLDVVQVQQWLTDIAATRGLDGLNDGFEQAARSKSSFLAGLERFRRHYQDDNDQLGQQKVEEMARRFEMYYGVGVKMAKAYVAEGPVGGNPLMGEFDTVAGAINDSIIPFVEEQNLEGGAQMDAISVEVRRLRLGVMIGGFITILIGTIVAAVITRGINRKLRQVIGEISDGSIQVASASEQLSSSSQKLAEQAGEQAAALEETSSALEELTAMTRRNADNAGQADVITREAGKVVGEADISMGRLTTAMGEVSKASEETSKIVKTIDEIAFQTNLLALNAAVEAARAGEAGAGFAVVADEVRNLAMRAAQAARNTSELIEATMVKVQESSALLGATNASFGRVSERSGKVNELVSEIAAASREQSLGIDQINNAITEMDRVTQANAATAEESASASEELHAQSSSMRATVADMAALIGGMAADRRLPGRAGTGSGQQKALPHGGTYTGF